MSELLNRVAALRTKSSEKTEAQRSVVRDALETAGLESICDAMREAFDAKLTYLKVGDIEIGKPSERGCTDFILLDWERKQAEKALAQHKTRGRR